MDVDIIDQILRQVFYFVDAVLMNSLLLRKNLCEPTTASFIHDNIVELERLVSQSNVRCKNLLIHSSAATELLQIPPAELDQDILQSIIGDRKALNCYQVEKLLRMNASKTPSSLLNQVSCMVRDRRTVGKQNESVFMDTFLSFEFRMPETMMKPVSMPAFIRLESCHKNRS